MSGMMRSPTTELTTAPNATPRTTPTARSSTFPRSANALNSFSIALPFSLGHASLLDLTSQRQTEPEPPHHHRGERVHQSGHGCAEQHVGDDEHRRGYGHRQEDGTGDGLTVGRVDHPLLVELAEAQPVIGGR